MKAAKTTKEWDHTTVENAKQILSLARRRNAEVTVELFSREKRCPSCHLVSSVFLKPDGICAHCWLNHGHTRRAS